MTDGEREDGGSLQERRAARLAEERHQLLLMEERRAARMRLILLEEATPRVAPDPLSGISVLEVANTIGEAPSTVGFQFRGGKAGDVTTEFRNQVYGQVVERFDTRPARVIHDAVREALTQGRTVAEIVAELCRGLAVHLVSQPATRWVLGVPARFEPTTDLAREARAVWSEFGNDVASVIELVVASRGHRLALSRAQLVDAVNLAVSSGWLSTELASASKPLTVRIDGVVFDPTGAVLWSLLRSRLHPGKS